MDSDREYNLSLIGIIKELYDSRLLIIKITLSFLAVGLFVAILSQKQFTTSVTFIPQVNETSKIGGSLGGLASIAGINLNAVGGHADIPPSLYPRIIQSTGFKKSILETEISISGHSEDVTFTEYFLNYYEPGILSLIKEYTIGLPRVILRSLRKEEDREEILDVKNAKHGNIIRITEEERRLMRLVEELLVIKTNMEDGSIELYFTMPEPTAAAQLVERSKELLQEYVIDYRIEKAQGQLEFVKSRYEEKKEDFILAQQKLAAFRGQNQSIISPFLLNEEERLLSQYNLVAGVYNELAKQVENAEIKIKEDTPNFLVIQPATVPIIPSQPNRILILFVFGFIGFCFSLLVVFSKKSFHHYFTIRDFETK